MRWRALFWLSLLANVALGAALIVSSRASRTRLDRASILPEVTNAPAVKTAVIVRRQFFSWSEVESDDYPTYIKNLRDIGCPEQTIRDIIIADVNSLYARRRALEVVTADQQWWRAEPDTNVLHAADLKLQQLEQERRNLLSTLLGTNWEGGDLVSLPRPTRPPVALDGPVLGALPNDVKQAIEQFNAQATDRLQAYLADRQRAGEPPDPAELARLRKQFRLELAGVLSAPQLEEYLLRYSDSARSLRAELAQLKGFEATPAEFRAMFRVLDPINEQLIAVDDSTPQGAQQRATLLAQGEAELKLALGEQRYAQYQLMHDARYRDAYAESGSPALTASAGTLYQIKLAAQQEQTRINDLSGLTDEQRAIELKRAELEQLKAVAQALGQELPAEPANAPKPPPVKIHNVANGEGLNRIAQIYGVQPSDLRAANPNLNFEKLKAGDQVKVPFSLIYPTPPGTQP